jgi:hypothetical protein
MANLAVAEEGSTRTARLVVVDGHDDWHGGITARVQDGRCHQGKSVVDVDYVRRELDHGLSNPASGTFTP